MVCIMVYLGLSAFMIPFYVAGHSGNQLKIGNLKTEWVATFVRNRWQLKNGMGGNV